MIRSACVLALTALLAGCGGGEASAPAGEILSETAAKLGEIRSGELKLSIFVEPRGENAGEEFGFELEGPFALAASGQLPKADISYTQTANGESETVKVISTGEQAYVEVDGETARLTPEEEAELRATGGDLSGGLTELRVEDWIEDPKASGGGDVGGAETDKVTGDLNLVALTSDLADVAQSFGGAVPDLSSSERERLAEAVEDTTFELYSGQDDRLLRRLLMEAEIAFDVPEELRRALGDLVGAKVTFELEISDPNEPIEVEAPTDARILPAD